ncbi:hypothetical protein MITSMUL_05570 [Mitsuokella multacida DSM 20544]|uniref:Uncharacterized protein n=1 Tax=Mitsuokella multacida DSM 20544 TaxID=500635 RepID=C9KQQ1_9FIRM|nr:hypothetical protein MITSMUL_05570 [Mitsuokella multacida DSM 20544]
MKVNKKTRGCKDNEQLLLCLQDADGMPIGPFCLCKIRTVAL